MSLSSLLDEVQNSQSFLAFAKALLEERKKEDQSDQKEPFGLSEFGWENDTISSFLESAIAWAEDTDFGIDQGIDPKNLWRRFALFLYSGKIYE